MTGLLMCGVLVLLLVGADRWERSERARRDRVTRRARGLASWETR